MRMLKSLGSPSLKTIQFAASLWTWWSEKELLSKRRRNGIGYEIVSSGARGCLKVKWL